jgi:hypothetical protein
LPGSQLVRRAMACYFDRLAPGLGAAYLRWGSAHADESTPTSASVLQVRPVAEAQGLARHEIRSARLLHAARDAYAQAVDLFEVSTGQAHVVIPRFVVRRQRGTSTATSVNA